MKNILPIVVLLLALVGCQETKTNNTRLELIPDPEENPDLTDAQSIAYNNGLAHWNKVSELRFTFNVDRGGKHYERSWRWKPKTDDVTLISENDTVTYNRKEMDSLIMKTDAGFVNDSYWLLAPYKLVWDQGTTLSKTTTAIAPISKDTLNKLTITYGNKGGYTPGDAYDFYFDTNFRVKEWIFRKGNDSTPSMMTTWEDYKDYNGLTLSKMHQDSTGGFKLYFTDISVKK